MVRRVQYHRSGRPRPRHLKIALAVGLLGALAEGSRTFAQDDAKEQVKNERDERDHGKRDRDERDAWQHGTGR